MSAARDYLWYAGEHMHSSETSVSLGYVFVSVYQQRIQNTYLYVHIIVHQLRNDDGVGGMSTIMLGSALGYVEAPVNTRYDSCANRVPYKVPSSVGSGYVPPQYFTP